MKPNVHMKNKTLLFVGSLLAGLIITSCNSKESAKSNETSELDERFARNCEVVRANNAGFTGENQDYSCLLYTSPSPRDLSTSRMPSSA